MGLNIKNERVHALAREAARLTGKSQTGAIEEALERLLAAYDTDPSQLRARGKADVVHRLVADYVADPGDDRPAVSRVEDLFDPSTGLPR